MDEDTLKLGLLLEAAQSNQKLAETGLKTLEAVAQSLAEIVREEVRRTLDIELQALMADSNRASNALRSVRRAANMRVAVWSMSLTVLCTAIPLGLSCWIIPSPPEIRALRAKRDEMARQMAALDASGGRIDLRRCGESARLCVRVDRTAPVYGEKSDYLIVRGY